MSAKWAPKVAKTVYTTLYHLLPSLLFLVANYALAESNVSSTPALDVPSSQLASSVYLAQGKESLNNAALPLATSQIAALNFTPAVRYGSGGYYAVSVAVADVNGDGKPDIILTNYCADDIANSCEVSTTTGSVSVLLGNGDGTFQTAVGYSSGGYRANSVAVADVNGDGKPDLLVANWCNGNINNNCANGTVGVLLGNGDGTFQTAVSYATGGIDTFSMTVADVDGDGKLDLVAANYSNGTASVLLGQGDGTFQTAVNYSSGGGSNNSVALADVNADGKPDILIANGYSHNVGILLGNGDGTFQTPATYDSPGQYAFWVTVADVNGDSKPDLLVADGIASDSNNLTGSVGVLLGNGDGTFQKQMSYGSGGNESYSIAVADINGDGKLDLISANCGPSGSNACDGAIGIALGNGDGTFQTALSYASRGHQAFSVAVADLNGDGKPDIVATNRESPGSVSVLINTTTEVTETALASSFNPSNYGQNVTFTATVTGKVGFYKGTPTGSITFYDGTTQIGNTPLVNGEAGLHFAFPVGGNHSITAAYSGDAYDSGSTSPVLIQYVRALPVVTSTTIKSSTSFVYVGQPVTLTANVGWNHGIPPDGELVTFRDLDTTPPTILATAPLTRGVASVATNLLPRGTHTIWAKYSGDGTYGPSYSSTISESVLRYASTTTVTSTLNPSSTHQAVTFVATVTGQSPTGSVTFIKNKVAIATVLLVNGQASYTQTLLTAGTKSITVSYSGDANNRVSSSGVLSQVVNP